MCTYSGSVKDPLRYSSAPLPDETINEMTKVLLNEELENYSKVGLNPFCKLNPPPDVSAQTIYFTVFFKIFYYLNFDDLSQAESEFWKKEYDHEAAKKARAAKKATKKTVKKVKRKSIASNMFEPIDSSKSEVALDSLGSFFNYLIDTDYHQDDTEASQAGKEEVMTISSGSEPLPRQNFRW